jgi:Tol biopolymer transport system component
VVAAVGIPSSAHAAFPGANGKIAFESHRDGNWEIYTMNADGSDQTRATNNTTNDYDPAWSPDGKKIAFASDRDRPDPDCYDIPCTTHIYVMNADGTGQTRLTNTYDGYDDLEPAWTPDGTRITFARRFCDAHSGDCYGGLLTMNADGSGLEGFRDAATGGPAWAPDGTRLAFEDRSSYYFGAIYSEKPNASDRRLFCCSDRYLPPSAPDWSPDQKAMVFETFDRRVARQNFDRTGFTYLTGYDGCDGCDGEEPDWSPDGTKMLFVSSRDGNWEIYVMHSDGTDATRVTTNPASDLEPDWQSLTGPYPRPKGATPLLVSLVPAFEQCTTPNSTHGEPLDEPSCAPPAQTSSRLSVSGSSSSESVGSVRLDSIAGIPGGADDSDVNLRISVTDVRCIVGAAVDTCTTANRSAGPDYSGELRGEISLRITDKDNSPSAGAGAPATVSDVALPVTVPCTDSQPDFVVGSACETTTTLDTLVPGSVKEGKRAVWELGQIQVFDGGQDGVASTTSENTLFLTQGIFIP